MFLLKLSKCCHAFGETIKLLFIDSTLQFRSSRNVFWCLFSWMNFRCPNEKSINLFYLNLVVTGIKTIVTSINNFCIQERNCRLFLFSSWTFRIINDVVFVYIMIKYEHVIFVGLQHVILFLIEYFEASIFIFLRRVLLEMASLVFISKWK